MLRLLSMYATVASEHIHRPHHPLISDYIDLIPPVVLTHVTRALEAILGAVWIVVAMGLITLGR